MEENKSLKKGKKENKTVKNKNGIKVQIQNKIGLSIIAVMAAITILVVGVVYTLLIKSNNTELQQDSEAVSLEVEKYFAPFERMAEQLAIDKDVQKLLTTTKEGQRMTENPMYSDVLDEMSETAGLDTDNIQGVFIADLDSNASITSYGTISGDDYDCTTRAWYECTKTGKTMLTEPYISASKGNLILSAVAPVYGSDKKVVGVAGIDVVIDTITNKMKNYTIGSNGYTMLMTSDGTFIYHPTSSLIDKKIQDMKISDSVGKAISAQSSTLLKYKVDGNRKYGYIMPIGDTGFIALSCIPNGQYYSSLVKAVVLLLIVIIVGITFILLLIGKLSSKIVDPLIRLNDTAMELANGNLNVSIDAQSDDEVGELGRSIEKTVIRLKEYIDYIDEISKVLADMADGKLSIDLKYAYVGEFEKVKDAMNHISKAMTEVMTSIMEGAKQVSVGSDDLAEAAQGMAENTTTQATAIDELLETAITVADKVKENRDNSEKSAQYTNEVADVMEDSKKQMAQMREAMDKIQESSQQVVGVIKAIEDIATQTNLLSLNASIEAARAGEAGKGFAVVAGEIGGLANESANAVNTTRNLISVSLEEIDKGNTIVNDVIKSLDNAVERVRIANEMIQGTAQTADTQMKSIDQIRDGIKDMSEVVQDNSAVAEETSATSEELAAQAVTLNELVQKFEL
ncbi:methyl-accepting chemotaxis protein [Eubacterium sp. MSJ-13]|uniref:methyl-accepting chemotaxis protein n=1 Tax=Eubacterium sp. MSJ-13 TaxID=2841513 RepID=UPI001C0FBE2D|nr:methyl-accepting chemotaxis protein [Eubacterium sp. MSJ-13]MBU5478510.1 methyl-accepting chemotaxis protein [Eubacterium sp. MSJ-13]